MKTPLVSIGIPFHNAEATFADAIRSVFAQTYVNWELILADDGSTDSSLQIAKSIEDSRVRVISDGANRGLSCRLNQIADLTRGEYLFRMDADDLMHPQRVARQLRFLERNPFVDLVDSVSYTVDDRGRLTGIRRSDLSRSTARNALRSSLLFHPTVAGRTSWFRKNRYDVDMWRSEDFELWCRTVGHSTFDRIAEPLHFYREGKVNVKKYLASGAYVRKVLRRYGPTALGRRQTSWLLLRSHLKGWFYYVFGIFHAQEALVARRGVPLDPAAVTEANRVLQQIADTPVPGFSDSKQDRSILAANRSISSETSITLPQSERSPRETPTLWNERRRAA